MRGREIESGTLIVGDTTSRLVSPDDVCQEVNNFFPTEEGSLRSIVSVWPYISHTTGTTIAPAGDAASGGMNEGTVIVYGEIHGVHHAVLRNQQREILLVHTGNEVWDLSAPEGKYTVVLGPEGSGALLTWQQRTASFGEVQRWPTQFITTPNGVVIIPETGRMFFYDGEVVAPLGFTRRPNPPTGLGPEDEFVTMDVSIISGTSLTRCNPNTSGYTHHGLWGSYGQMDTALGRGRLGTIEFLPAVPTATSVPSAVDADGANDAGQLLPGAFRCKVAWVDRWGNISAPSFPSAEVTLSAMKSRSLDRAGNQHWQAADRARFQIAWDGIGLGPPHTIGRILYRTKDLKQSGDTNFYFLPGDAAPGEHSFATLPDRSSTFYPDNVPSEWLTNRAPELDPVPIARLGALAFGRFWAANFVGRPGTLQPSLPGLYGTFESNTEITPDPTGTEITGLHTVPQGLLVFTRTSTFLIVPNDSGEGFRVMTLNNGVGCVAPSSIASLRDGLTVWLGKDGFYGFDGSSVSFLFTEHRDTARNMNRAHWEHSHAVFNPESGQYECWVPYRSSRRPNRRFKFDGSAWHWDDYTNDIEMSDSTVVADHRNLVIGGGRARILTSADASQRSGVWALDRGYDVQPAKLVTGWIRSTAQGTRAQIRKVHLWLRETGSGTISVAVRRNYRAEVINTVQLRGYHQIAETTLASSRDLNAASHEKNPSLWGSVAADTTSIARRRRPFWAHKTIEVMSCECFQLEITAPAGTEMEIIGFQYEYFPTDHDRQASRLGAP